MKVLLFALSLFVMSSSIFAQTPPIEPGVSQELARWRAVRYSDVRYKLNLTLEKMSPVLKGTMEIRVKLSEPPASAGGQKDGGTPTPETQVPSPASPQRGEIPPIILDWRKIKGHEEKSTVSNVSVNGKAVSVSTNWPPADAGGSDYNEHLILRDGIVAGENVIKLDFTSPILTSGSAITRYVDKEDGSEYIYSLFVPSDASSAFPVFDQPDLKARFSLAVELPYQWNVVANGRPLSYPSDPQAPVEGQLKTISFEETQKISSYVFAFAAGNFDIFSELPDEKRPEKATENRLFGSPDAARVFVRKSQAAKFKPHAAEVFRLNREAVKYFEQYFDYKFPFPKYDLVLIPEFPFGGMEHAGATFLREASIIFPQEPTKNDLVSRATLIFHEAAHQWFGDTVTMRWFDDLWLKEGFATFTAYKALEKIMPEMNSWKVFYERIKQGAYQTDSTRGTTAIYQPIANLSAAKSAYGNIVYNKAPAFLRQAEFYLGEDKFQTAVQAFLKKHEFGNAGWEDLVKELGFASNNNLSNWAAIWVKHPGLPTFRLRFEDHRRGTNTTGRPGELKLVFTQSNRTPQPRSDSYTYGAQYEGPVWSEALQFYYVLADGKTRTEKLTLEKGDREIEEIWGYNVGGLESRETKKTLAPPKFVFTNYGDYGYGIFLLDEKSRDYVLKNIQNEKDPFLRAMMWGALWDSVREGELDPRVFVELVVKNLAEARTTVRASLSADTGEIDESTVQMLLSRVSTAMNYYISEPDIALTSVRASASGADLRSRVEDLLIERMRTAPGLGQRITFYRAFLNIAASQKARGVLKTLLKSEPPPSGGGQKVGAGPTNGPAANAGGSDLPLKTKDRFDIVTRLLILGDPEAAKLLADLEKTETSDDAKRYAYAARAGIGTAENKAKYWNDFVSNKEISESWIEAAFGPWNSIRHSELTLPYLHKALQELPNHKRNRKIFFVNGWLGAFLSGQRSAEALAVVNKFLADNPGLDNDLRLKVLENVDLIERAVNIRRKFPPV